MGSRFIVTGATGYLGKHVVQAFSDRGDSVIAVTRSSEVPDSWGMNVTVLTNDLWAIEDSIWKDIVPGSTLIHLAWRDGFIHDSPAHMGDLSSHFKLLELLISLGLTKFVSTGTMHEIGAFTGEIPEDVTCNPVTQYGIAKNAFRLASADLCHRHQVDFAWLRCFYITGDDLNNNSIFTKILQRAAMGEEVMPLTPGLSKFDFIDVGELAHQIVQVSNQALDGVMNLGSGEPKSLREMVESFVAENEIAMELDFGAFPERPGIGEGAWPDTSRLRSALKLS